MNASCDDGQKLYDQLQNQLSYQQQQNINYKKKTSFNDLNEMKQSQPSGNEEEFKQKQPLADQDLMVIAQNSLEHELQNFSN